MRRPWGLTLAALAAGLAAFIASHHPISPALACATGLVLWAWAWYRQHAWLLALPALLPVASLAPWTGWVVVEEFDFLLLSAASGTYARQAMRVGLVDGPPSQWSTASLARIAFILLWVGLGMYRGLEGAGETLHGWFHSQADALNAWRVGKSVVFAVLVYPLLRQAFDSDAEGAFRHLGAGMVTGAAVFCMLVLWERTAYAGLIDWSVPYRTTGWFWDMHVGGAAIDAYLALATPFVAWAVWVARGWARWLGASLLAIAWTYACLTTYARGAYVGAAFALLVLALRAPIELPGRRAVRVARLAVLAVALITAIWWAIEITGQPMGGLLVACGVGLLAWRRRQAWLAGWGLSGARIAAAGGLILLLLFEVAAVVGPDSFMWRRLGLSGRDSVGRLEHWSHGLQLIQSPGDLVLGRGLGRLPEAFDARWTSEQFPGRARWRPEEGGYLRLTGPRTSERIGGLFGLTQRVPAAQTYAAGLRIRSAMTVELLVRVCESHLLYDRACQANFVRVMPPSPDAGAWQAVHLPLVGPPLSRGSILAPRSTVLTVSVTNAGAWADIDDVDLFADGSRIALANGSFADGLARWWPVAQYHFLPWHADNLLLELLIESGAVGLAIFLAWVGVAWRAGARAGDASAAWVASASLAGALSVGLVSSVVDAPRLAWLLWLMGMTLLAAHHARSRPTSA